MNVNFWVVLDACVLEALKPWGVCACHPSDYLITLFSLNTGVVVARLEEIARKRKRTPEQHLALLGKSVPSFAAHMAEAVGGICRTRRREMVVEGRKLPRRI